MTLSVIEIECVEGECVPRELYRDPDIECIIRINQDTQSRTEMVRSSSYHQYAVVTNPYTFIREIRRGWTWIVESRYRSHYSLGTMFIPTDDETYTLDQLQNHQTIIA